eukprot:s604_g6.t1
MSLFLLACAISSEQCPPKETGWWSGCKVGAKSHGHRSANSANSRRESSWLRKVDRNADALPLAPWTFTTEILLYFLRIVFFFFISWFLDTDCLSETGLLAFCVSADLRLDFDPMPRGIRVRPLLSAELGGPRPTDLGRDRRTGRTAAARLQGETQPSPPRQKARNWLAITHQLPISEWYFEETSPWTLDYPPAFAYFEWLLSQVAVLLDPAMLQVRNLDYASEATEPRTEFVWGGSVILVDVLLALGAYRLGGAKAVALVLWNSALLLVDHVHFQYNGMLLGILLLSISCMETGRTYLGALLFCLLLCMKHIFLYVSPVFFVYLLRFHCGLTFRPLRLQIKELLRLGLVVLGTFLAILLPLLISGPLQIQLPQLLRRLFPFGRGLTHAYWAPNAWALYNTLDRVLAKVLGASTSSGSTSGFAEAPLSGGGASCHGEWRMVSHQDGGFWSGKNVV